MDILWFVLFGLIVGVIAKLIMPGKDPGGIFITAILGMAGSIVGSFLGQFIGIGGGNMGRWILAVVGAILLLWIYRMIASRRVSS